MTAYLSAIGSIFQGDAQARAYNFNAQQQEQQGVQQRNIDIAKAADQGRQNEKRAGAIRAAYGAAGVDPDSGTPLEVMSEEATHGEMNRQRVLWQGVADQQSADTQGSADRAEGSAARTSGYISALGALAKGAEQAASATAMSW